MTNGTVTAEKLLQAQALILQPDQPFTWASGLKSPIYCDNRKLLSLPFVRDFIKSELSNLVFDRFQDAELIAGVATAGIAWGALVADQLKLPFIYVRPKPKEHGRQNQIEGAYSEGQRVVVIEDLVSTGQSSLQAIQALQAAKLRVLGLTSIFSYNFVQAAAAFSGHDIPFYPLTDYQQLVKLAAEKSLITPQQVEMLLNWRQDPTKWAEKN